MNTKIFEPEKSIYTPPEVSAYGLQAIENIQKNERRALSIGISEIKDYFTPLMPGQLAAVIAQTSHYKSGFLHCIEQLAAQQLERDGRTDEALIHVSVEEGIEEQAFLLLARESGESASNLARGIYQDWDKLQNAAIRVGTIPIYRIGESLARAQDFPYLTISNMIRSIQMLADGEINEKPVKIAGLFFDYLQAFPFDAEVQKTEMDKQRRLQVRQDIYRLRQAAAYFNCPVWVAVQAKQTLKSPQKMYIPAIYDGEESSAIAQRCDRIVQLWMPKMTHSIGTDIDYKDMNFTVEENLLWVKVGKQRGGLPSGKTWKCRINFEKNMIAPENKESDLGGHWADGG